MNTPDATYEAYSIVTGRTQGRFPGSPLGAGIGASAGPTAGRGAIRTLSAGSYLGNVLNWGDTLFNAFAAESLNAAINQYSAAQQVLGPPPSSGTPAGAPWTHRIVLRVDEQAALPHFRRAHANGESLDIRMELYPVASLREGRSLRSYRIRDATLLRISNRFLAGSARGRFVQELELGVARSNP